LSTGPFSAKNGIGPPVKTRESSLRKSALISIPEKTVSCTFLKKKDEGKRDFLAYPPELCYILNSPIP